LKGGSCAAGAGDNGYGKEKDDTKEISHGTPLLEKSGDRRIITRDPVKDLLLLIRNISEKRYKVRKRQV